jgi:hypothetical protein
VLVPSGSEPRASGGATLYGKPVDGGVSRAQVSPRRLAGLLIGGICWLAACGQSEEPTSLATVEKCLEDEGLEVRAAMPRADDDDAPDRGQLVTRGAFVAFYSSSDRAEELAAEVRKNADQARGEVARYDDVTVLYLPNAKRDTIETCVEP